jgi:hypothetical protein
MPVSRDTNRRVEIDPKQEQVNLSPRVQSVAWLTLTTAKSQTARTGTRSTSKSRGNQEDAFYSNICQNSLVQYLSRQGNLLRVSRSKHRSV